MARRYRSEGATREGRRGRNLSERKTNRGCESGFWQDEAGRSLRRGIIAENRGGERNSKGWLGTETTDAGCNIDFVLTNADTQRDAPRRFSLCRATPKLRLTLDKYYPRSRFRSRINLPARGITFVRGEAGRSGIVARFARWISFFNANDNSGTSSGQFPEREYHLNILTRGAGRERTVGRLSSN